MNKLLVFLFFVKGIYKSFTTEILSMALIKFNLKIYLKVDLLLDVLPGNYFTKCLEKCWILMLILIYSMMN